MPPPTRQFSLRSAAPRWWLVVAVLLGAFSYAYLGRAPTGVTHFEGATMGTTYRVVLGSPRSAERVAELQTATDALLKDINASMSTYDPESELSRFNDRASTEPVAVSPELAKVVALALEVSRASGGTFDVTVGPLVDAWGFGPKKRPAAPPSDEELTTLRERVGYGKLKLDGNMLSKAHPDLRVDLSAIAKGYGVDQVAELLEARGETDYLVEIGGEVRTRGKNAEGRVFRVGIEEPDPERRAVRLAIALPKGALATSGNYRNFHEIGGQRFVHTLDPNTGTPVQHTLLSASVVHTECAVADAWATALMAAGPEKAWTLAQANGLEVLLLEAGPDRQVIERATPGFKALYTAPRAGQ